MVLDHSYPKKSLGQHWLTDPDVLLAMCDAIDITKGDEVLEIGPGLGTLTAYLLNAGAKVTALEFDHDLACTLVSNTRRRLEEIGATSKNPALQVIESDIRTYDLINMSPPYKICANIPYYLTSNLIRKLCDASNKPSHVALLVQKEVAQRIVAEDGKMSTLSSIAHFFYECYLGDIVPARLFTPPPKVTSQIVIMHKRKTKLFELDETKFFRLIKAGFGEKRKTLRNSLSAGLSVPKVLSSELLKCSGIDPMRRAETLSLDEWKQLYDNLDELTK